MSHGWRVLPSQGAGSSFLVVEVTFSGVLGSPDPKLRTLSQGCLLGLAAQESEPTQDAGASTGKALGKGLQGPWLAAPCRVTPAPPLCVYGKSWTKC